MFKLGGVCHSDMRDTWHMAYCNVHVSGCSPRSESVHARDGGDIIVRRTPKRLRYCRRLVTVFYRELLKEDEKCEGAKGVDVIMSINQQSNGSSERESGL